MLITLDKLERLDHPYRYNKKIADVLQRTIDSDRAGQIEYIKENGRHVVIDGEYATRTIGAKEVIVRSTISDSAAIFHLNYMEYLTQCWGSHLGIVLTPDIVWFGVLNELAKAVIEHPNPHRPLFTRSAEKTDIVVRVAAPDEVLPLAAVMMALEQKVPVDIGLFIPSFSTTTQLARFAHMASFAETCSPYYSYMTFACGFPSISIEGEIADYERIVGSATRIRNEFARIGSPIMPWIDTVMLPWVTAIRDAVLGKDGAFFKQILSVESCGSGGEIAVDGWWSRLFRMQPDNPRKPDNFPTQVARVEWTNIETKRRFNINCGVFSSTAGPNADMVPEFGWVQNEILE